MTTKTVNISFQSSLLSTIDKIAKKESRTRSDFLREAARAYIQRKKHWDDIFSFGDKIVKQKNLKESDILSEIKKYRKSKK